MSRKLAKQLLSLPGVKVSPLYKETTFQELSELLEQNLDLAASDGYERGFDAGYEYGHEQGTIDATYVPWSTEQILESKRENPGAWALAEVSEEAHGKNQ